MARNGCRNDGEHIHDLPVLIVQRSDQTAVPIVTEGVPFIGDESRSQNGGIGESHTSQVTANIVRRGVNPQLKLANFFGIKTAGIQIIPNRSGNVPHAFFAMMNFCRAKLNKFDERSVNRSCRHGHFGSRFGSLDSRRNTAGNALKQGRVASAIQFRRGILAVGHREFLSIGDFEGLKFLHRGFVVFTIKPTRMMEGTRQNPGKTVWVGCPFVVTPS